jgi:hypothetical protein
MKWLCGEIKKLGFKPGIWTAPFGTGNDKFYNEHKDWFLHYEDGRCVRSWNGKYTLDPSVEEAREHLKKIHDKASHDWGYEFFKIDGMSGRSHGYCAHLYERPDIRKLFKNPDCKNPFELCVKVFREGIGEDRIFLACQGHFTGAEAKYADASRTGADIVHPYQPVKWENILLQARCTINQIFANGIVFWSDPDCMLISQQALDIEQARVETTIVALPGQQMFAGDKLAKLAPERIRLLQQALPVCDIKPAKLYPEYGFKEIWDLAIDRSFASWHVTAFFNWGDEEKTIPVKWSELGEKTDEKFIAYEFWTNEFLGEKQGSMEVKVPPRSVRLVTLQRNLSRPQFLSSDRHITQGGVELKGTSWKDGKLTVDVEAIATFPVTVRAYIPEGFNVKNVKVPNGVSLETAVENKGRIISAKVTSPKTKTVQIVFE